MRIFAAMMLSDLIRPALAALAIAGAPAAVHAMDADPPRSEAVKQLQWADLLPPGEVENISRLQQMQAASSMGVDHFGSEQMPQIKTFNTVDALDGETVALPGYVLPFDFSGSGEVSRFLLVPFVGACIHVPPPPPNQLVYVTSEEAVPVSGLWDAVIVTGVMRTARQDSEIADAAYTLELTDISAYRR